jgi:ketopantoate hydroxymethyltransferase
MATQTITQGNMFKIVVALTADDVAYADLGTADVVKVLLIAKSKVTSLALEDSDVNVTLDDPSTGSVSWQLTSAQTDALPLGSYDLAVQVEYGGNTNKLEWVEENAVRIIADYIA